MSDHTEDSTDAEDDDKHRRAAGLAATGAAGAVAGGLGSAALAGEATAAGEAAAAAAAGLGPAGVPLAPSAAVGPVGVPLDAGAVSGPTGVPLGQGAAGPSGVPLGQGAVGPTGVPFGQGAAGPSGVPIGEGAAGPTGVPMTTGAGIGPSGVPLGLTAVVRAHRVPFIAGVAVVATLAVGAVVLAARNDDPPSPSPSPSAAVTVTATSDVAVAETPATTTVPTSTDSPTTVATVVVAATEPAAETGTSIAPVLAAGLGGASCVVGSWLADNQVFGYSFASLTGGLGTTSQISGAIRVDIAADGAVVTTYDNWMMTADLQGATAVVSLTGADTNTIGFADDGSFSVTASQIGSHLRASSGGLQVIDGPSQQTFFQGSGTFTCAGDQLDMIVPGSVSTGTFTRSG